MAREKGVTLPQIALAYVLSQPKLDIFALVGCTTPDEYRMNADGGGAPADGGRNRVAGNGRMKADLTQRREERHFASFVSLCAFALSF